MTNAQGEFLEFIEKSPSVFHAAREVGNLLAENDYEPINERERWHLKPEGKYFTMRDHAAVVAFSLPKNPPKRAIILASHLDSPALKLKPDFISPSNDHSQLLTEVYGAPLLTSWLNCDLGIAGRIITDQGFSLVNVDAAAIIPQLAIHLDREVNEKGLVLNRQDHLKPLIALDQIDLTELLRNEVFFRELISSDLFLYPLQKPRLLGPKSEMLASYRLDNLSSAYASLYAMAHAKHTSDDTLYISVFWDHEEIGSKTQGGAESAFLLDAIKRISASYKLDNEGFFILKNSSMCVSIDVTHAYHPNYPNKHDPHFTPLLGKGVAIKYSSQQKYTTSAVSASKFIDVCKQENIPFQKYVGRSDLPSGSTVGPPMSAGLGMHTIDIGLPLLSMHSSREIIGMNDHWDLCKILKAMLERF